MTGNPILDSALVLGGVGLFFGFMIAMANKKFQVWEDPRIDDVEELLPSTNCGACGQPGCRAFAEAVVGGKPLLRMNRHMSEILFKGITTYLSEEGIRTDNDNNLLGQLEAKKRTYGNNLFISRIYTTIGGSSAGI